MIDKPELEGKEEYVSLALNLIDFSLTFNPVDKDFDRKEYGYYAKSALKTIENQELISKKTRKMLQRKI